MPASIRYSVLTLLVVILCITLTSCGTGNRASLKMLQKSEGHPYDLIIVPGVPLENGQWSQIMKARIYWSKYLMDRGLAKNVMYSGGAVYTPYVEAEVMASYAEAIGIPKEHIYTESKAQHSTENIYYSYKKASKMGFKSIALASDPFQTRMLRRYARKKVSADIAFLPIVFDTLKAMEPKMKDPQLTFQPIDTTGFVPLPERKKFWERMRGTMGKHVDTSLYE